MPREKAVVILSGGLDSTLALYLTREKYEWALALTFNYGQRAALQEQKAARQFCELLKIKHQTVALDWLAKITPTALVNRHRLLPQLSLGELDEKKLTLPSADAVWVPNRNGLFLNIAAAFAESLGARVLLTGFNAEEAATFPDNSVEYVQRANAAFAYSTQIQCRVEAPTIHWNKTEMVRQALKFKIPFEMLWSCYKGGEKMCGRCESCLRSKRAYLANGLKDLVDNIFLK